MEHPAANAYVVELSRDAFGEGWTLEDDRRFWKRMHGRLGLLQLSREAEKLTTYCLCLNERRSDRDFLVYRLRVIKVCILLSFLESVPRLMCKELPHFFARFAAQMFCEILSRAELVVEENSCSLIGIFREDDGAPIEAYTYRTTARTAAGRAAGGVARPGAGSCAEIRADA